MSLADDEAAYYRLVDQTKHALIAQDWPKVHAIAADAPAALVEALRLLALADPQ